MESLFAELHNGLLQQKLQTTDYRVVTKSGGFTWSDQKTARRTRLCRLGF
jgi:hypothetical protein